MPVLPPLPLSITDLPDDPAARHEVLVDLLGYCLMWNRGSVLADAERRIANPHVEKELGVMKAQPFKELASLDDVAQEKSLRFARACIDAFMQRLLVLLGGRGQDHKLGESHAVRFRLSLEVLGRPDAEIEFEEVLSWGGQKSLPSYFGRWLNRFGGLPARDGEHPTHK